MFHCAVTTAKPRTPQCGPMRAKPHARSGPHEFQTRPPSFGAGAPACSRLKPHFKGQRTRHSLSRFCLCAAVALTMSAQQPLGWGMEMGSDLAVLKKDTTEKRCVWWSRRPMVVRSGSATRKPSSTRSALSRQWRLLSKTRSEAFGDAPPGPDQGEPAQEDTPASGQGVTGNRSGNPEQRTRPARPMHGAVRPAQGIGQPTPVVVESGAVIRGGGDERLPSRLEFA